MNEFVVDIDNKKNELKFDSASRVILENSEHEVDLRKINENCYLIKINFKVYNVTFTELSNGKYGLLIDGHYFEPKVRSKLEEAAANVLKNKEVLSHHEDIKAPMPGLLVKLFKEVGDTIKIGEPAALLEAMKMENELRSPATGTITKVNFKAGESVDKDAVILEIE